MNSEPALAKKIVVLGLDNAGKTSILDLIINKVREALNFEPTRGVVRKNVTILGQEISIHDLGGQETYRHEYLEKPVFFTETDAVIFVIDLQDRTRYHMAVDYFKKSIDAMALNGITPKVFVFFHKHDGDFLEEEKKHQEAVQAEIDSLEERMRKVMTDHGLEIEKIFMTSIFDEWSCFFAFHEVWGSVISRIQAIHIFLEKLLENSPEINFSIFLDGEANILADKVSENCHYSEEDIGTIGRVAIPKLLEWKRQVFTQDIPDAHYKVETIVDTKVMMQKIENNNGTFFIVSSFTGDDVEELQMRLMKFYFTLSVFLSITQE